MSATQLKGANVFSISVEDNSVKEFLLGSDKIDVYIDQTGRIISVARTPELRIGNSDKINSAQAAQVTPAVLPRDQAIQLLNQYKDKVNLKRAQYGHTKFNEVTDVIAPENLYTQKGEIITKTRANLDTNSFAFNRNNEPAVEALISKRPPKTSGVIVFPSDLIVSGNSGVSYSQDTIRIKALQYVPPQKDILTGSRSASIYRRGVVSNNQFLNDLEKDYDYQGEVILPMPLSIRDAVGAEWGVGAINTLALGLFSQVRDKYEAGGLGTAATLLRTGFKGFQATEAWLALADAFVNAPGGGPLQEQILNDLSSEIVGKLGIQVDPLQVLSRATGSVVNNNAELLFRGPKLRSFDFSWKLSPRSVEDSKRIRQMVRFFKINSLPTVSERGAIFMETPNVFILQYVKSNNQRNEALPQPKVCALLDFRVDYTPDGVGWAAYGDDSQPVTSVITAVFHELTPLFANEYAGLPEDSVGF